MYIVSCTQNSYNEDILKSLGKIKYKLPIISGYAINLKENQLDDLKKINELNYVCKDACITPLSTSIKRLQICKFNNTSSMYSNTYINTPKIDYNKTVSVAVLDTGVCPVDDLIKPTNRIIKFKDFINNNKTSYDDNGHGTHVAGIICGSGYNSNQKYVGIAPNTNLICLKILDADGSGNASNLLAAVQWVMDNKEKYNIKIINLSIGTPSTNDSKDPLVDAVEKLWDSGVVVVTASGNSGPAEGTITSPGVSKKVITVGCCNDNCITNKNKAIEDFSGRGPTFECVFKPDLVCPGINIISCLANTLNTSTKHDATIKIINKYYVQMSGTSMSTPIVSGAISLLLSKEPNLTPNEVKLKIKHSCIDMNLPQNQQGWGLLNIKALLS